MRAKGLWAVWLAGLGGLGSFLAACGGGSVIITLDVYSFIKGTGKDTVPYYVPVPGTLDTASAPQVVRLFGAGSSIVDSVIIAGTANLVNQTGAGTLAFKLYLAADAAGTRLPGALALAVPAKAVSGATTVVDTISCPPRPSSCLLSSSANSLFTKDSVWVRVAVTASNTGTGPLPPPFGGTMALSSLRLTVVTKPKLF
jgi:hypothetical protein